MAEEESVVDEDKEAEGAARNGSTYSAIEDY